MNAPDALTSRRDFLKKAAMLSGSLGAFSVLPPSLSRAAGITPRAGSTFMDAKRVVILMQENRSYLWTGTCRVPNALDEQAGVESARLLGCKRLLMNDVSRAHGRG